MVDETVSKSRRKVTKSYFVVECPKTIAKIY